MIQIKSEEKIEESLKEFTKEQLIDMLSKFMKNNKSLRTEVTKFIEQNLKQFKKINEREIDEAKFNELWDETDEIINTFNEYGGGPYEKEETVYDNLENITELIQKGNLGENIKKEFIEKCMEHYFIGNSGFDDVLIETIFEICKTREEWMFVLSLLKKNNHGKEGHTHDLIMKVCKDKLNDEEAYLKERMSDLKYGLDYFELVKFYESRGDIEKALEFAEEGLKKGEGRIIDLIEFMIGFYKKKNDYPHTLNYMILAFKENPSLDRYKLLKKFCSGNDWIKVFNELYSALEKTPWVKAEIDYYNKNYSLVWAYAKDSYSEFDKWAEKLETYFPKEIIKKYTEKATLIINARAAKDYYKAAGYCKAVKRVFLKVLKNEKGWPEYISNLRGNHQNLPALQRELEEL